MRVDELRVQSHGLLTLRESRIVLLRVIKRLTQVGIYRQRGRIKREGSLHFMLRVNRATGSKIICRIPLMSGRVVWSELKRKFELALGLRKIPQPERAHKTDRRVRFAKLRSNFQRLVCLFFGQLPIWPVESVTIRQANVSQRELRVFVNRPFKERGGLKLRPALALVPKPSAFLVIRERLCVRCDATRYCCVSPLLKNNIAAGNCEEDNH